MTEHIQTTTLRDCFRKLRERMAHGSTGEPWQDSGVDLLDSGKRSIRISTRLVAGEVYSPLNRATNF